ncbi:TraA family conjugative transfer protein [Methylomonas sp. AM2-LC]|uniref:TraA family conjugative transfer protein n=1 Tax=Methylomonas sp. AM2-LC TaxID=3153301 RepID=UPI003266945A
MKVNKKAVIAASLLSLALATDAMAGTDTTFSSIYTKLTLWTQGTLGQVISLAAFLVGLGAGVVNQSIIAVVIGISIALALNYAPTIIGGIVTGLA